MRGVLSLQHCLMSFLYPESLHHCTQTSSPAMTVAAHFTQKYLYSSPFCALMTEPCYAVVSIECDSLLCLQDITNVLQHKEEIVLNTPFLQQALMYHMLNDTLF